MSNKKKLKENLELLKIMLGVTAVGASVSASMAYLEYKYPNNESHKNTYTNEREWYNLSKTITYPEGPVAIDYNNVSLLEENNDIYSITLKNGDKITVNKEDAVFIVNGESVDISSSKKVLTKTK